MWPSHVVHPDAAQALVPKPNPRLDGGLRGGGEARSQPAPTDASKKHEGIVSPQERDRFVNIAMLAVLFSCVAFALTRLETELSTGLLTPWWGNALGAAALLPVWIWFRRAPPTRATPALHLTGAIAVIALVLPVFYGMNSTIWWLSLVGLSAAAMLRHREALVWAAISFAAVIGVLLVDPALHVEGAAGENPTEVALSKIAFALVLIGVAFGLRRLVERRNEELAEARELSERLDRSKEKILAHMSHEARGPLTTIAAMTDLVLRDSQLPDQLREPVESAHHAARLLTRLVQDVLDASRLHVDDALSVRSEPFSLHRSLSQVLKPLAARIEAAGLSFSVTAAPDLAERRIGDADRLSQIALNLVSNAMKFTTEGGIQVHLELNDDPDTLCLRVKDSGRGIPQEALERIFEPYVQIGETEASFAPGAGLGLTITRVLVERMGGKIELRSRVGEGSEFCVWLRLPIERGADSSPGPVDLLAPARSQGSSPAGAAPPPARAKRRRRRRAHPRASAERGLSVIVVDDDAVNRLVLERLLVNLGHRVTLRDTAYGVTDLVVGAGDFDVLLTDIDMPGMSGLELAAELRGREARLGLDPLPIMAVTGHASDAYRAHANSHGIHGFLSKPFARDQLAAQLDRLRDLYQDKTRAPSPPPRRAPAMNP